MQAADDGPGEADRQRAELEGYFGPDSMTWRLGAESVLLLGGGRAVLMQLAHPLVAAGVAHHSSWARDPWGRTMKTLELTQHLAFGTRSEARAAARYINHLHTGVTGTLGRDAGEHSAASAYHARDPELLMWVAATLIDTVFTLYQLLVGPLTPDEQARYYQESIRSTMMLGMPEAAAPPTLAAFRAYMDDMLSGDALAVTPEAHEVARVVMHMPAPFIVRPVLMGAEQVTIGLLPPRLRALYGFSWDGRRQMLFDAWARGTREVYSRLPESLRILPAARAARRRVRGAAAQGECA